VVGSRSTCRGRYTREAVAGTVKMPFSVTISDLALNKVM